MIEMYKKPYVIAEIGCNHKGDFDIALELVNNAKTFCNADAVKFQKRNPRELLTKEQFSAPHPNPINSFGKSYGEHREFLELNIDQHREIKKYCEQLDVIYSCSVWDLTSAQEIALLNPIFIKIPSACNNDWIMLQWLCENYGGEIHVSTGMTTKTEIALLVEFFKKFNRNKDLIIYNCTSGYPVPFEDVCLLDLNYLKDNFDNEIKGLGFSGHHLGIAVDIAAYTLGAHIIERHFTLDRTWKGTDHAASLEPLGLRKLKRDLEAVFLALNYKTQDILPIESLQREKLKKEHPHFE